MEDQGKRLLLAVAVAFAVILVWEMVSVKLFPPPEPPPQEQTTEAEGTDPTTEPSDGPTPDSPKPGDTSGPKIVDPEKPSEPTRAPTTPAQDVERGEEQIFEFAFPRFRAEFTSYGGNLKTWELQGEKYREANESGQQVQMDLVRAGKDDALLPFGIHFEDRPWWPEKSEWTGKKLSDTEVEFRWTYVHPTTGDAVFDFVKQYELFPDEYLLQLTVHVINRRAEEQNQTLVVSLFGYQDPSEDTGGGWTSIESSWKSSCYINGELKNASHKSVLKSDKKRIGKLKWAGINHSYFFIGASPHGETAARMGCNSYGYDKLPGVMRTDIVFPERTIQRGQTAEGGPPATYKVSAYMGPKYLDKLESVSGTIGHDPLFVESIDFGWFGILARPLLWLLQWLYSFLGNWGVAIIFLTVIVKLATLYWNTKSIRSMRKMAKLKPQMEAIQKKHKDDKQRQQQEVMNLYKAHGVNPISGCLPMLLQMPIWFALYRTLMAAAELYHSPFIPGWIDDLTAEDPYYILPIALMGMMFLQAKLSPTTPDSTQQKIMMYGMPLMFGVFGFFFPSGLTLYILTNTVLTSIHNLWMTRTDPTNKASKAAAAKGGDKPKKKAGKKSEGEEEEGGESAASASDSESTSNRQDDDKSSASKPSSYKKKGRGPKPRRRGGKRKRGGGNRS